MFQCPYNEYSSLYREKPTKSHIRILHASPNTPAVDVYLNNRLVIQRLHYRGFSNYLPTASGSYSVKVFPAGRRDKPLINTNLNIPAKSILTLAAIGTMQNISLLPIVDPKFLRTPSKTYVRFAQISPNTPNVDLTISGAGKVFNNVGYTKVTNYIPLNAGVHTFDVNESQSGRRILHVPNIRLLPNRVYTFYSVGLAGKTPPLQALVPLDGSTYIKV